MAFLDSHVKREIYSINVPLSTSTALNIGNNEERSETDEVQTIEPSGSGAACGLAPIHQTTPPLASCNPKKRFKKDAIEEQLLNTINQFKK